MNRNWQVEEVLPHKPPMILIDEIFEVKEGGLLASVQIGEDSLFYETRKGVPVWVGIEYMAQAVAAHVGALSLVADDAVRIGFLLGVRRYEATEKYFTLGQKLKIVIRCLLRENDLGQYQCQITDRQSRELATAKLSAYMPQDSAAFLETQKQ